MGHDACAQRFQLPISLFFSLSLPNSTTSHNGTTDTGIAGCHPANLDRPLRTFCIFACAECSCPTAFYESRLTLSSNSAECCGRIIKISSDQVVLIGHYSPIYSLRDHDMPQPSQRIHPNLSCHRGSVDNARVVHHLFLYRMPLAYGCCLT